MLPGRTGLWLRPGLCPWDLPTPLILCSSAGAKGPTGSRLFLGIWFLLKVFVPSPCLAPAWVAELCLLLCLSNTAKGGIAFHSKEVLHRQLSLISSQVRLIPCTREHQQQKRRQQSLLKKWKKTHACLAPCVSAAGAHLSPVSQFLEEMHMDLCAMQRFHKTVMFPHEYFSYSVRLQIQWFLFPIVSSLYVFLWLQMVHGTALFFFVILGDGFLQELVIQVLLFPNFWMN